MSRTELKSRWAVPLRANSLLAIVKGEKVRPVLYVSGPAGHSFNDCVDSRKLEKVKMDAALSLYKL